MLNPWNSSFTEKRHQPQRRGRRDGPLLKSKRISRCAAYGTPLCMQVLLELGQSAIGNGSFKVFQEAFESAHLASFVSSCKGAHVRQRGKLIDATSFWWPVRLHTHKFGAMATTSKPFRQLCMTGIVLTCLKRLFADANGISHVSSPLE